ncbi:hypothetical protein [Sulfitobacter sp. R18_1]|uniref:hypothetical protein n=1 Tax=Sulfitobacter sp. R18_1 TaxID=2821104 RepID=UPI001ADC3626|nr:hypothetical protein [Sulfitobacter sp. R18_1]MBO9428169.1 hypothetical protein [Sulfitobacter sp. R18_1]
MIKEAIPHIVACSKPHMFSLTVGVEIIMPGFGNKYFVVKDHFRILKNVGSSPSNTYIGRSRACTPVLLSTTAQPGDEIHDLVGGLHHVCADTGETHHIQMVPSKGLFEKSYGANPEAGRIVELQRGMFLEEIEGPTLKYNYAQAREFSDKTHPELTGGIRMVDRDPLEDVSDEIIDALQEQGVSIIPESISFASETAYSSARACFALGGAGDDWSKSEDLWILTVCNNARAILRAPDRLHTPENYAADINFKAGPISDLVSPMVDLVNELAPGASMPGLR